MKDILEREQVLMGMFYLNGHPNLILFDSGATHDFINKACTQISWIFNTVIHPT
jgi:hypothetical protein